MRPSHLPRRLAQIAVAGLLTLVAAAASSATTTPAATTTTPATAAAAPAATAKPTATTATTVPDTSSIDVLLGEPPKTQADVDRLSAYAKKYGVPTPDGWMGTSLPAVRGHIQTADTDDNGIVMYNESLDLGAVMMVTFTPGGGYASIIKTFKFDQANPPQLTLLEPGDYLPVCHPGHPCEKVHSKNQVISLCFGEASCSILYYDDQELHDVAMTD